MGFKWKKLINSINSFYKAFALSKHSKSSLRIKKIIVPIKLLCKNGIAIVQHVINPSKFFVYKSLEVQTPKFETKKI